MSWEVSPILVPAINEVRDKHPGMTIFTIGDEKHREEVSDHNPDPWGFVCAADFMRGPKFTAAAAEDLFDRITAMIRRPDNRPAYAIYNGRIVSSTVQRGVVRAYDGDDPHTGHLHLSVPHGSQPHPTSSWGLYPKEAIVATPTWSSQTVLDVNFLFAEARRAAIGNATGTGSADVNARNLYVYMREIVRASLGLDVDGSPSLSDRLTAIENDTNVISAWDLSADAAGGDPSIAQTQIATRVDQVLNP